MYIVPVVTIDGALQTAGVLGAFVSDEVCGVGLPRSLPFRPYAGSSTFDTVIYSNWTYLDELPSGPTIRGMNSPIRSYEKVGSPSVSWLKALRKESLELRALPAFVQ